VLNVKTQATRTVAPADVPEARTPEGVTTKHPPRRPVKGRRLSKNESAQLSVKEEQKSIPNERRLSATTEDARNYPGRLLCDERRVSTRAEGYQDARRDPGRPIRCNEQQLLTTAEGHQDVRRVQARLIPCNEQQPPTAEGHQDARSHPPRPIPFNQRQLPVSAEVRQGVGRAPTRLIPCNEQQLPTTADEHQDMHRDPGRPIPCKERQLPATAEGHQDACRDSGRPSPCHEGQLPATAERHQDVRRESGAPIPCNVQQLPTTTEGHQDPGGGPAFAGAPIPRVTREATVAEPEAAAPAAPAQDSSGSFLCWALKTLNEGQAAEICTDSLDQLAGFELRVLCPTCKGHCPDHVRCRQRAEQAAFRHRAEGPYPSELKDWADAANQPNLGTWMVWMVHRVYLNDPSLESLDFGCFHVPRGDKEPRILPKLFKALASNTHLKHLMLGNTALESDKVCISHLGDALRANSTLEKLDLQANFLEMCDLAVIFEALAENTGLKELKVNFQACAKQSFRDLMLEQGNDVYKAAAAAFRSNRSLVKLDLILLQRHWQDQICRGLMQNRQELRKSVVPKAGG